MSLADESHLEELRQLVRHGIPLPTPHDSSDAHTQQRRSAVLVLFGESETHTEFSKTRGSTLDLLLTRRAAGMRHHAGEVSFPGGGVEDQDADSTETAVRETTEETGLGAQAIEVIGALREVPLPVSNNLVTPVIAWRKEAQVLSPDARETADAFRVPLAELRAPNARGTFVLRRGQTLFRGPAFVLPERFGGSVVWGFTGILLSTILDELGWSTPWDRSHEIPIVKTGERGSDM